MTQSIQNFDNHNRSNGVPQRVPAPQVRPMAQNVRIPDYYAPNEKRSFKDVLEEMPIYSMIVKGFFGPLIEHPFASLLTWFGCGFLLDKYTSACGGEYDKSLLKKVTNFGDRIANSKFNQSKPMQSFLSLFKKGGEKGGKIIEKSPVLGAVSKTPTLPEWPMVLSEMMPQRQRVVHDFNQIVNTLELTTEKTVGLNKLALDKEERRILKSLSTTLDTEAKASSFIQLRRLGVAEDEIIKNIISKSDGGVADTKKAILKAFGNKDEEWLKNVRKDTIGDVKLINEVEEATKKVGNKVRISLGNFKPFGLNLGFLTTPIKRVLGCDNIHNRLFSLNPQNGATKTGRFMSRFMQMVHRGLTFGGGKLGVLLFIAPAFVETAINVHKAEPEQKVGTGVSNLVNHISWVFTFPFALQIMHHICGAKYSGLSKDQIQEIRDKRTAINDKNKLKGTFDKNGAEKGYKNYGEWKEAQKEFNEFVKNTRQANFKKQKWYNNLIARIAGVFTHDLEKLDAYNTGNWLTTKLSQARNLPRNMWGVPARFIIFLGITMGILDPALNKGIKAIFGESYDSMKEEEIKDAKKEQKRFLKEDLTDRLYEAQRKKVSGVNKGIAVNNNLLPKQNPQNNAVAHHGAGENSNAIPQVQPQSVDNYTYIPSQQNVIKSEAKGKRDNYSYIPSQNSTIKTDKEKEKNTRSYIPSQRAANISKTWDNSGLQSALNRADRAEQRALKVLAGNFEGM